MNWVGGFRTRMILKQERQKQREFFQKKKMKSKLKLLQSSYSTKASLSFDLLNLHVVNQISEKKECSKYPQHFDMRKSKETCSGLRKNAQLPMSPITVPSKICLDDSEIISLQTKTVECWTNQNSQTYITKKDLKYEAKLDVISEAKSRNAFHSESNKKQASKEAEPGFQDCLYENCTSDSNDIKLPAENTTNKVTLPLQCSASYSTKLSLFEIQDEWSPHVSKLNKNGKPDVSVHCNLEQEHKFIKYFHNCIEAVNFPNNTTNVQATRRQSSTQLHTFET